ncbi:MAG TPA: efflux RND transporter periplasmic adaptor subunit [Acidocella sp.]|jgi:multidrug efflux system membrane fusion protein|uniref:efflux RND transporter periplasmic adaptor subunit n=1 Tax=Acidocella sp. TaxID=50710 RepID=UPI002C4A5056|nr:efflux RND transporter periplasmic adaptor subunit [Acidocella sp.]HVE21384.1 efflux RND transporter periplasmic adaptor subunit [Acidocella sp.]
MLKMRHSLSGLAVVLGLAGCGWYVVGGQKVDAASPPAPVSATPVAVTQVAQGNVPVELSGLGHVQAFNQVTIKPQVSGQITQIDYEQGHVVQKGQLLVQIDPRPFQAKVNQDQANLARDLAHLANARTNLNRDQPLARSGFVSAQQADTQQSMVAQELAAVAADKAVLEQDQLSLDYASIKSPITGVAGLRLVDIGNVVQPSDPQGLVTVTQVTPIAMLFTLPQAELPDVQSAMNHDGGRQLTVEAWSDDGTRKLATGCLTVINNTVDAASGTITLRAVFTNQDEMLWPGEFVQARLIVKTIPNGLTVPAAVIQRGPNGAYVWVVPHDDKAKAQPVTVGQLVNGQALVTSGLAKGETVVTDGQYGLTPGAPVMITSNDAVNPLQNAQTQMLGIQP